ncbi:hypothetical protein [Acinetobacter sp.]|jgi:hypothetical protein|uniref:hypothetical protein n=1 Tax=Acinetobacter sp. TaxID=472 RepID=UPI00281901AD|nr:hypothetical protein [Acinetobacter sp.]MDR0237620.1 hypothetical protein [Acinetobacter sp.]
MKIKKLLNSTLLLCLLLPTAFYFTVFKEGIITFGFGLFLCFCSYSILFYSQNKKRPDDLSTSIISSFAFVAPILFLGLWAQMSSLTSRNFQTYLQQHGCIETNEYHKYTETECHTSKNTARCKKVKRIESIYFCKASQETIYESRYTQLYGPIYGIWDDQK